MSENNTAPPTASQAIALTELPGNRAVVLRNGVCPYCGRPFSVELRPTKEHVIGRKFVPVGSLNAAWNLILNACQPCNNSKSDLENDISVITMHPSVDGAYPAAPEVLAAEVARRAQKTTSRHTGKPVAAGEQPMVIKGSFGGASLEFTFQMPPQVREDRLFDLARLHLMAFVFFQTYDETKRQGSWWRGAFHPMLTVRKADWGNPRIKWFAEKTANADVTFKLYTANGFYKAWIKQVNAGTLWAWAMEWNQNFRLIGFFGDEAEARELAKEIPALEAPIVSEDGKNWIRMRTETPLVGEDALFGMFDEEGGPEPPVQREGDQAI